MNGFQLVTELIDPEMGEPAQEGELVFATLTREAVPLLRYRSGDRAAWGEYDCWLLTPSIRPKGRTMCSWSSDGSEYEDGDRGRNNK